MGWTISHGPSGNYSNRSYGGVRNLAHSLAHALTARDWALLRPTFIRRSGDPFTVSPDEARVIADLLDRAADSGLMDREYAGPARDLAAAARRAAAAGEPWSWS